MKKLKQLKRWNIVTRKSKLLFLVTSLLLSACVKDKPNDSNQKLPESSGRKVWIANEGSLGNGNASLSIYNITEDSIFNKVFLGKNNQNLGDVFQSMTIVGDNVFLAINNSDKIQVVNKNTYQLVATIPITKPRQMLLVNENKMYVSSLFHPEINIVNPKTFQVIGKINTDFPNTEGMLLFNNKVYAANWDTACNYIYEINPNTDSIVHRITISGAAPTDILKDKNNLLWVLSGDIYKNKSSHFTQIDPTNRTILKSFSFPIAADIIKPIFNPTKDTLYFLGVNYDGSTAYNGLYRMDINATSIPNDLFIAAQPLQYFWGLGIDTVTTQIYISDPKGFIQNGGVQIFNPQGVLQKSFQTSLGPGSFLFE